MLLLDSPSPASRYTNCNANMSSNSNYYNYQGFPSVSFLLHCTWISNYIHIYVGTRSQSVNASAAASLTLKSFVLLGGRASDACWVFRFRLTVFCYHFYLNALHVLDEICRRSLNFVRLCIQHESAFVRFIALHGLHARSRSLFGWNVLSGSTVPLMI